MKANKSTKAQQSGFSLLELMIGCLIALIVSYAVLQVYLAQSALYKTANSQTFVFSIENAIANLISPPIRSAGFLGCGSTSSGAMSNLNEGGTPPLGTFNSTQSMITGYSGSSSSYTLVLNNPANDSNAGDWSPALPVSLLGQVQQGSDVVIVLGATPDSKAIGVTQINSGSSSLILNNTSTLASGQLAAVSDCAKSVIFQITALSGTAVTHDAGGGTLGNTSDKFLANFQAGSQLIPLQQTAFFVGQGSGDQSALMRGILNADDSWTVEPIVPGVEFMRVQYGIGKNGAATQYVRADQVTDWTKVYSIRIGFLMAGKTGSANNAIKSYTVLDATVTVPEDSRLRHVFQMTIQLRNASS